MAWLNIATWIILYAAFWVMFLCYTRECKQAKKCIDELMDLLDKLTERHLKASIRHMQDYLQATDERDRYKREAEYERSRADELAKLINQMNRKNE